MWNALHGEDRPCGGATLAEGIAVKNVGKLTLPIIRDLVSDVVLVSESQLERAVNAYLTLQKTMAEGAGAAGLAAMLKEPARFAGKRVGLILCGGNIDPRILASIMVRELERGEQIVSFRLTIPDRPGVLGQIASRLGELGANILEVDHKRLFLDVPAKGARLDVTVETRDRAHAEEIIDRARGGRLSSGADSRERRDGVIGQENVEDDHACHDVCPDAVLPCLCRRFDGDRTGDEAETGRHPVCRTEECGVAPGLRADQARPRRWRKSRRCWRRCACRAGC